jgi:hypothetical protein
MLRMIVFSAHELSSKWQMLCRCMKRCGSLRNRVTHNLKWKRKVKTAQSGKQQSICEEVPTIVSPARTAARKSVCDATSGKGGCPAHELVEVIAVLSR